VSEKQSGAIPCCRRALAAPEAHKSNPASPRRLGAVHYASATLIRPPSRSISRKCHQLSLAIVSRTAPGHLLTANDSNSRRFSTLIQPKNRTALSEGRRRQGDRSLTILKHAVRIYARWFLLSASLSLSSVFGLQSPCVFHQLLDDRHRDAAVVSTLILTPFFMPMSAATRLRASVRELKQTLTSFHSVN